MKRILLSIAVVMCVFVANAQTDGSGYEDGKWIKKGVTGINLSQTAMKNWSAGGENSIAGNFYLNGSLTRKSGNWLWINTLVLDYGLTKTKSQGTRKSTDKIRISTQLGYSTDNVWFYTLIGDLNTQFTKGYNYPDTKHPISTFFAPAYSGVSLGMEYRPKSFFSIFLSPVSSKMTFVNDDYLSGLGVFGLEPGKRFKAEFGAYAKARAEMELMENVKMITTADVFLAYDKNFGNADIDWDLLISMKINKYLSATFNTTLKYDNDVKYFDEKRVKRGARIQLKEILGVGLAYNF